MAPGSANDELLGKAMLYKTYREFGFDKDPHGAARFGIFSKADLEAFRYIDGHPEVQHVFAAVIAEHRHAIELDANQPRMWPDGSVATREHHERELAASHTAAGLHAGTSNLLGAAGLHIGQLYHPDDIGKQVALAGVLATTGEMMLVSGEIAHAAHHAGDHLPYPGGPLYAPGTKQPETPFEKNELLPGHKTYSPDHTPHGGGHGGGHAGGHAPHHLEPDSGAPAVDLQGPLHTPNDANFLDPHGNAVHVDAPASAESAAQHPPHLAPESTPDVPDAAHVPAHHDADSSVAPSLHDPGALASPPDANYTGPHGHPEYFDPDSANQLLSSHSTDVAADHQNQTLPHIDPDSSALVSEPHQAPADWHVNEATQQSVVDTDVNYSH